MKKIKIKDATIAQLNWLVAIIAGAKPGVDLFVAPGNAPHQTVRARGLNPSGSHHWSPLTDWAQGGPLFADMDVLTEDVPGADDGRCHYCSGFTKVQGWNHPVGYSAPTKLEAIMRTHVERHLGDDAEVPDEL